jgi:hypothetical protein
VHNLLPVLPDIDIQSVHEKILSEICQEALICENEFENNVYFEDL